MQLYLGKYSALSHVIVTHHTSTYILCYIYMHVSIHNLSFSKSSLNILVWFEIEKREEDILVIRIGREDFEVAYYLFSERGKD